MSAYLYFVQCTLFYVLFHSFSAKKIKYIVVIHKRGFKNPLVGQPHLWFDELCVGRFLILASMFLFTLCTYTRALCYTVSCGNG